jgi:4-diphosphocytidyl-2-C-methyl-D-erythritol kinase
MKSYAKVNIGLNILNKRNDGYHNIETIFIPIDLYDEITIEDGFNDIIIETNNPAVPTDERNTCHKAVKLLENYAKTKFQLTIGIEKKIPIGAGLGGGSSNAAKVLDEIVKLKTININKEDLLNIALKVGSDVPYFLNAGVASAKGRGEILVYLDITIPYWIVIVYPSLSISTKWAYDNIGEKKDPKEKNFKDILLNNINKPDKLKELLTNDFEPIVFKRYPGLISIKNVLYEKGAVYASLSGSGSSLFGLYDSKAAADRAYNAFANKFKVFITEPDFEINYG